ncbi:MAG: S1C family serine protease [Candidatus Kapaibacteriales bacterium]
MKTKIIKSLALFFTLTLNFSCSAQEKENPPREGRKIYFESQNSSTREINDQITTSRQNAITRAVELAVPAVVGINVIQTYDIAPSYFWDDPWFRFFFGDVPQRYQVQGLGSGFIISSDGYILTNHHVAGNASKIIVTTTDGKKYDAELVGSDIISDVALLKINAKNLPYLKLGNSDDVLLGEWAIAMGNPFGLFDLNSKPTITVGVISNKGVNFINQNRVYKDMIQTDAAISSGNSGGPLLNSLGEVIGINTVIYSTATSSSGAGSIGIGWAIPINRVKKVIDKIVLHQKGVRGANLGLEVIEANSRQAAFYGVNYDEGLLVIKIVRRSLADLAGFEPGDVILEINGTKVNTVRDFQLLVYDTFIDDTLIFQVVRNGKPIEIKIKIK